MTAVFTIAVFSLPSWATPFWHEGEVRTREAREREARAAARAAKRLEEYRKEDQTQSVRPAGPAEAQSRHEARAGAQERQTWRQEMQSRSREALAMESGVITLVVFGILVCVASAVLLRKASARRRVPQTPPPRTKPTPRKKSQATPASSATPARRKNPVRRKEPPVAPVSTAALETARIQRWRQMLEAQIETLRSVHDRLAQCADPPAYLTRSAFAALRRDAEKAAGQFPADWPNTLADAPEIRMLQTIREFLDDPARSLEKANHTFVTNELSRSRQFFDRIEARPLTDEQRRAVVTDGDRNLVVAAAGSGKTSAIVAKAGWLLHRGDRRPPELLLLAFARDARKELEERLRKRLGADAVRGMAVSTFHSQGLAIIGEAEGQRPALAKAAEDDRALTDLLKNIVTELRADRTISATLLSWFQEQFAPYRSPHEFQTWGAYWDYIRRYGIRSLKGEQVKSFEECEIANFLYLHGVSYEYERAYEHNTGTPEKGPYRPDFYLPDAAIYIEHFGLDANGKTAPFVPQKEYLRSMAWKRHLHAERGTTLIETFSHEHAAGTLTRNLAAKLQDHGVSLSPIPPAEAFAVFAEQGRIDPFIRLLATFLHHYKGARLTLPEVAARAASAPDRARAEAFLAVFQPIFERYQETLSQSEQIDFHDMIDRAAAHIEAGRYRSPFGYILVDEFQDISPDRARLLKALLDQVPGSQLFAVGDDWQAIFRFAGSDIGIMREFGKRFGDSENLSLETTFRCADRIATAAATFVLQNPAQIPKTVRSEREADEPRIHVGLPGEQNLSLLPEALDRIAEDAAKHEGPSNVLVLGRYWHTLPQNRANLAKHYPGLRFTYRTVHRSKGLEADYVVLLGLCSGKYGFPAEIEDDPLLDLVLASAEEYPDAEERRLLYVAVTRARRHVFLLVENGPPSSFARELARDGYDVTVFGRPPEGAVSCPLCVEGRLTRRENRQSGSIFYGCSNYPYCEHQQQSCPDCGKGLVVKADGGFRCRDCGHTIESCPKCSGWLQTRRGQYGRFLGCTNYPACGYTRDLRQKPPRDRTAASISDPGRRISR